MGFSLTNINGIHVLSCRFMTTRSGASYRRMEEQRIHAKDVPAGSQRTTGGALPEIASLTEMVRVMIQDRERREREIAEERARRDEEREEERARREREREDEQRRSDRQREESELRIAEMRRQIERLQELFAEQSAATVSARIRSTTEPIKLTKLTDEDDIESYLTTFERITAANEVNKERWSFQLAPHLTGKAQQAYAALPTDEAKDYDTLKEAILRRYDINEETYRQQFRKQPKEGEPPQELITRLKDLATRWARDTGPPTFGDRGRHSGRGSDHPLCTRGHLFLPARRGKNKYRGKGHYHDGRSIQYAPRVCPSRVGCTRATRSRRRT